MSLESQPLSKVKHVDPAGYLSTKTIAALCTPTGGAICILRISGDDAFKIAALLCGFVSRAGASGGESLSTEFCVTNDRIAKRVFLRDAHGKKIDDAVMIPFVGPRSFSGEDVVEFFLHGSPIIAQKVLDEIFSHGARLALPGEFSFRAVRNGKLTLSQAEAIKELVSAENDFALDLALEKLSGSQHELIIRVRDELMQLVTLAEAGIDFSDQDLDEVSLPRLKLRVAKIFAWLTELGGSFDRGKRFLEGIPVSVFGLPNAGKSSFFNALLGEDRSIVSDIAGTTRDVVKEKINLKGTSGYITFKIADTAGLRRSEDSIESIGIERTLKSAQDADLILVVVDGLNPSWELVLEYLLKVDSNGKAFLGVITKKDLLQVEQLKTILSQADQFTERLKKEGKEIATWIPVSSVSLDGMSLISTQMTHLGEVLLKRKPGEVVLTQIEHVQAVDRSLECLNRAKNATDIVLFATDIRYSMNALGPLIGETIPDDILGKIFSDFCIGK